MAETSESAVLYSGIYDDIDAALAGLRAFQQLHRVEMIGKYDAAVIVNTDGEPHVIRRADHPGIRVIPEWLGSGALPRGELHDAARALDFDQAALIMVGEPTLEKGFEKAATRASKIVRRDLNAATDELSRELAQSLNE